MTDTHTQRQTHTHTQSKCSINSIDTVNSLTRQKITTGMWQNNHWHVAKACGI